MLLPRSTGDANPHSGLSDEHYDWMLVQVLPGAHLVHASASTYNTLSRCLNTLRRFREGSSLNLPALELLPRVRYMPEISWPMPAAKKSVSRSPRDTIRFDGGTVSRPIISSLFEGDGGRMEQAAHSIAIVVRRRRGGITHM